MSHFMITAQNNYANYPYQYQQINYQNISQSNSAFETSHQNNVSTVKEPEHQKQQQQPDKISQSRWGRPVHDQEINYFRQSYMPWYKPFTPTKLQNNSTETIGLDSTNPSAGAAMKLSLKSPDKLSSYIERAFQKCINASEREFMEAALKKICNASKARNNLFTKDWDALPLPTLPREGNNFTTNFNDKITGPQYTTINSRLEQMDVMIPNIYNPLIGQSLVNNITTSLSSIAGVAGSNTQTLSSLISKSNSQNASSSVYQQFQLQPQIQLSQQQHQQQQNPQLIAANQKLNNFQTNQYTNSNNSAAGKAAILETEEELQKRKKRLDKFNSSLADNKESHKLLQRQSSLIPNQKPLLTQNSAIDIDSNDLDYLTKNLTIKGTCTKLEKSYFRLTSAPDPSDVRPEHILKKTLKLILSKWKNKEADYKYIDDQFRSIRQDLTVQSLHNQFCVKVYEAHARIALECADLDQFNQCQTQLHYLYRAGFEGHRIEFLAYKILYQVFCEMETETLRMLKSLTFAEKQCEPVEHALSVRKSLACGNFGRFFKLYRSAPNMGSYLIDVFIDKYRTQSLHKVAIAYVAANVDLQYLTNVLAFDDMQQAEAFLTGIGCKISVLEDKKKQLMCRDSMAAIKKAPLKVKKCQQEY